MQRPPRFHVVNLGCKVNRVESDTIAAALISSGAEMADERESSIIIVNTCTVTGEAASKARKSVRHALSLSDDAIVIVTGCAASIEPDSFTELSSRVVVEPDKHIAMHTALEMLELAYTDEHAFMRTGDGFATRAGIKVQDGCANACTYCIVHVARGLPWSRPLSEVLLEVKAAEAAGAREVVLTGINLGAYHDDGDLSHLLSVLLQETTYLRFRLSSIEPPEVTDSLLDLISASDGRVCHHLHLPLQSGSDTVLSSMGRRYRVGEYLELVDAARSVIPDLGLTTDIIVGFPGETDGDFDQTLEVARLAMFSKIHVFRYSQREGTPAAHYDGQIPPLVKVHRAEMLRDLSNELRCRFAQSLVGHTEELLVEEKGRATSGCYLPARLTDSFGNDLLEQVSHDGPRGVGVGSLVPVDVISAAQGTLVCRPR